MPIKRKISRASVKELSDLLSIPQIEVREAIISGVLDLSDIQSIIEFALISHEEPKTVEMGIPIGLN